MRGGIECGQTRAEPCQLRGAQVLGPSAQRRHQRCDLTGRALEPETVERVGDYLPHLADLLPALFERVLRERFEVVDVEERHAEDLTDTGVDVARHGDVDDQQRTIATP